MKFVTVLFLIAVSYVSAQKTPIILCGRQLANARVLLCYGSEFVNKRMPSHSFLENFSEDSREDLQWPWKGRHGALAAGWERYKRDGLADECCLKPCTADVIYAYC